MNIEEIINNHYMPTKRKRLRENTLEGYESAFKCHVIPRWGSYEISAIERDDIQEWVDNFPTAGAAWKAFKSLRQVIRWAIYKFKMLVIDPTVGVEKPRKAPYFPKVLTAPASMALRIIRTKQPLLSNPRSVCALAKTMRLIGETSI